MKYLIILCLVFSIQLTYTDINRTKETKAISWEHTIRKNNVFSIPRHPDLYHYQIHDVNFRNAFWVEVWYPQKSSTSYIQMLPIVLSKSNIHIIALHRQNPIGTITFISTKELLGKTILITVGK